MRKGCEKAEPRGPASGRRSVPAPAARTLIRSRPRCSTATGGRLPRPPAEPTPGTRRPSPSRPRAPPPRGGAAGARRGRGGGEAPLMRCGRAGPGRAGEGAQAGRAVSASAAAFSLGGLVSSSTRMCCRSIRNSRSMCWASCWASGVGPSGESQAGPPGAGAEEAAAAAALPGPGPGGPEASRPHAGGGPEPGPRELAAPGWGRP